MDRNTARELYRSGEEPTIAKLMELDDENERLKKKIASLSQNSTNSSKPPSSDGPSVKRPVNEPSKRKPGGQPGHKGHKRELLPAEEMTQLIDLHPERCRRCGRLLADAQEIGQAVRNQTFDIPPIELIKTEYRRHAHRCACGCVTRASLPDISTESQFGPAIHALAAYLVTSHRVSRRGAAEIMSSVLNLDISLGAVDEMVMRVGDAMKPVVDDLVNRMPQQDHFNIDETGWKNKKDKRWIWAFVSVVFSVFKLSASRGSIVLESMLGKDFNGKITSDDFSAYNKYVNKKKWQLCWAHLLRKFIALLDGGPEAERFGQAMLTASWQLFSYWHLYKQRAFDTELWITRADEIRREIMELCVVYSEASDEMVRKRAQKTLEKIEMLFTFVRAKGVEPTNNAAERALRPVVQLRKMCFGSCSEAGEHFIERAFSIKETCRKHNKNILTYLSNLMKSAFEKRPFPALI
jgi:transposase